MNIPSSTYRLQFNGGFDFVAAAAVVGYLDRLGISHVYASPIFKAVSGSGHGYDVVDPSQIDPQLGGEPQFAQLSKMLRDRGMGWIQDIVPNHMAYDRENKMLMDVMENGTASKYFHFFDIEFNHPYDNLKDRLLAPFLSEFYGHCLDQNKIQLQFNENGFTFRYGQWVFPMRLDSYVGVLTYDLELLSGQVGAGSEALLKFMELTQALRQMSGMTDPQERARQAVLCKSRLWDVYSSWPGVADYIHKLLARVNGKQSNDLDRLLNEQCFRLALWKVGNEELNYRRFFTINSLLCLRMDRPEVFDHVHRLVGRLWDEGNVHGLRIDHIDGLYDPAEYVRRLRQRFPAAYMVAEKILDMQETLPAQLDLQGTTGYDFLNHCSELFVDGRHKRLMDKAFRLFGGGGETYDQLVVRKKHMFIGRHMAGDVDNLAHLLKQLLNRNRYGKDLTMYALRRALVEILAQFPIYRTYVRGAPIADDDLNALKEAMAMARNNNPAATYELDAIEKILLLRFDEGMDQQDKDQWVHFVKRFQQYTGPLTAKALEDTVFYIYNRLVSLNEVGGNPEIFGMALKDFHEFQMARAARWPHTMNATATHDTKRGEDMRCRIHVLSEIPHEWINAVRLWSKLNRSKKTLLAGAPAPDLDDEYFIYQTLVGAFPWDAADVPLLVQRMEAYLIKAIREAKVHTAWIKPDEAYERACIRFMKALLEPRDAFGENFVPFQRKVSHYGMINSLSQAVIKIMSPGIPDIYQGGELWDLNLVDPDNRRQVDFVQRQQMLDSILQEGADTVRLAGDLRRNPRDGRIKLFVMHRLLCERRQRAEFFQKAEYVPLTAVGALSAHLVAFARRWQNHTMLAVVLRFSTGIVPQTDLLPPPYLWKDTRVLLPEAWALAWRNVFTSERVAAGTALSARSLFAGFPVCVLSSDT